MELKILNILIQIATSTYESQFSDFYSYAEYTDVFTYL